MIKLPFQQIDDFILQQVIQDGPYSMAVQGYQKNLSRPVFIKLLKPHTRDHHQWLTRFTREAKICARLKHPHIVDVYTVGQVDGYYYMALEFIRGLSLKELLAATGKLPIAIALEVTRQVLLGLGYAHQHGIVHRDIKPGNILIDIFGTARLTDFGLAYMGEEASVTQDGSILGTPAYMAPEQITGDNILPATDFFALGATLYEAMTGMQPFAGKNYSSCIQKIINQTPPPPSSLEPDIHADIDRFVFALIEKDAAARPASAQEILAELEKLPVIESGSKIKTRLADMVKQNYHAPDQALPPEKKEQSGMQGKTTRQAPKPKWWAVIVVGSIAFILFLSVMFIRSHNQVEPMAPKGAAKERNTLSSQIMPNEPGFKNDQSSKRNGEQKRQQPVQRSKKTVIRPTSPGPVAVSGKNKAQQLQADRPEALDPSTQNTPASVLLHIQPWATVSLDGQVVDTLISRTTLNVPPGKHQLVLTHPNFAPKVIEINARPNGQEKISYSFLRDAAFLAIEVRPWAGVYIDGKFIDNTPLKRVVTLSQGEHLVELKNPYFDTYRQIVQLQAGDTLRIKHILKK